MTAIVTSFGRRLKPIDQMNNFVLCGCHIGKDAHKLGTCKVANFAPPHGLHSFHVEVFKEKMIVSVRQRMGKLKEKISTLVYNSLMNASDNETCFLPSIRELNLAGKFLLGKFQFNHCLTIVQRAFNLFSIRRSEKYFQAKVKACPVTGHDLIVLVDFFLYNEVEPKIIEVIPFNRYRLNAGWNITRLAKLVDFTLNPDSIRVKKLPPCLFERERRVLLDPLEPWGACTYLALEITKEQLVGFVNALDNILNGLRTNKIPVREPAKLFQLGQVLHQLELVDALAKQTIVAAMKSYAVIEDQPGNVNLLMQVLILFASIQFELVGFH